MKSKQIRMITHGAILAALYVALTYLQNWLLPGTTSAAIQFRASEALCIFALFTPAAIPGLTVGCLLFNISNAGALPLDWLVGTGATLLATTCMYLLRRATLWKLPLPALLMPAVWNAVLVGWELTYYIGEIPFWLNAVYVAAGEAAVLLVLGTALYLPLAPAACRSACSRRAFEKIPRPPRVRLPRSGGGVFFAIGHCRGVDSRSRLRTGNRRRLTIKQ